MYRTCLVCSAEFKPNNALEHLDRGRRVAYDPVKGRLWQVCGSCARWSLVPLESRWEALQELEKLVTDKARMLSRTDNVALMRAGTTRDRARRAGGAAGGGVVALREGVPQAEGELPQAHRGGRRRRGGCDRGFGRDGGDQLRGGLDSLAPGARGGHGRGSLDAVRQHGVAWTSPLSCVADPRSPRVRYRDRERLVVTGAEESPGVVVSCVRCRGHEDAGQRLDGHEAGRLLRRVLAYHHFAGSSEQRVEGAVKLIDFAGGTERLPSRILGSGAALGSLSNTGQVRPRNRGPRGARTAASVDGGGGTRGPLAARGRARGHHRWRADPGSRTRAPGVKRRQAR